LAQLLDGLGLDTDAAYRAHLQHLCAGWVTGILLACVHHAAC
jgi:hypothetical protein